VGSPNKQIEEEGRGAGKWSYRKQLAFMVFLRSIFCINEIIRIELFPLTGDIPDVK